MAEEIKALDYVDIEFVDILDTGSEIAGAVGRKYLSERGGLDLMKKFHAYSSGVLVKLRKGIRFNKLMNLLNEYLNTAVQNELINKSYADEIRDSKDVSQIKYFLEHLRKTAVRKVEPVSEKNKLGRYLNYSMIRNATQTEAMYAKPKGLIRVGGREVERKGYVLTMSDLAHNRAKQINSGVSPKKRANILLLKDYTRLPQNIPDLAFVSENEYEEVVNQIIDASEKALEKIVSENAVL